MVGTFDSTNDVCYFNSAVTKPQVITVQTWMLPARSRDLDNCSPSDGDIPSTTDLFIFI
jgi:hypothetical protein